MNNNDCPIVKSLYGIKDLKVGTFMPPFVAENHAAVIRQFGDLVQSGDKNAITMHPSDFAVFYLGAFMSESGLLVADPDGVKMLASGSDFVKKD